MEKKHTYDVRGKQSRIFRLYCSDKEGLLHMVFYRIAIIFALATAAVIIWSIIKAGNPLTPLSERFIITLGVLFIPQLFESIKAFSLIISRGIVFGRLNPSFMKYGVKQHAVYRLYRLLPYIVILVWVVGLGCLAAWWFG